MPMTAPNRMTKAIELNLPTRHNYFHDAITRLSRPASHGRGFYSKQKRFRIPFSLSEHLNPFIKHMASLSARELSQYLSNLRSRKVSQYILQASIASTSTNHHTVLLLAIHLAFDSSSSSRSSHNLIILSQAPRVELVPVASIRKLPTSTRHLSLRQHLRRPTQLGADPASC